MKVLALAGVVAIPTQCESPQPAVTGEMPVPVFISSNGLQSPSYKENIAFWRQLAEHSGQLSLWTAGASDAAEPIHIVTWSAEVISGLSDLKKTDKTVMWINNGIHPGEPDGIDACQLLVRELLQNPEKQKQWQDMVIAITPVYNVGGTLNRNSHSRANQQGPEAYGFRGNAQNLDLNRDCIKMDSRNARTLAKLFVQMDPDLFIDTHVSNGADYQHTLTLLTTQEQKLGGPLETFYRDSITRSLFDAMDNTAYPMVPYVNVWGRSPAEGGIYQFMDWPRYTNGYAALHHTPAYTIETHMLKPFAHRVEGTRLLLERMADQLSRVGNTLQVVREQQKQFYAALDCMPYHWELDSSRADTVRFMGYAYEKGTSAVSGKPQWTYNREKPFTLRIPYHSYYRATRRAHKPSAYIIPRGFHQVAERLMDHGVEIDTLRESTTIQVDAYKIVDFQTVNQPYEKHYLHSDVVLDTFTTEWSFRPGDFIIHTGKWYDRLLTETLQPDATDSYFAWNFFDAVLQQKEGYSPYVWDGKAAEILASDSGLHRAFGARKESDPAFADNHQAQLYWVYRHSDYYEKAHRIYPVFRRK